MTVGLTTVLLFVVFGVLLFLGVPISVSILVSALVTAASTLSWDQVTFIAMQKMNSGVESFSLLAIPLFILAGNIMNNGGIARRLINFAQIFVGKIPGSLAQANILGNMLFGALSGSSVAAASAMGGTINPIEKENGYDPAYAAAANIASAPTGLLIPPTSAFIVYSTVAGGVSVSTLFMAGYIPGILMGICCMGVALFWAIRHKMKAVGRDKSRSILRTTWEAIPSLLLIIIVIGGIVAGIFTATEGAGVAVLYCLVLSLIYRSISLKSFMDILLKSAKTSGIIMFLISASSAMSFVMAYAGIPQAISSGLMGLTSNKYVIFLLMNIILLLVGMFMDITPAILIFTPIFLPIATKLGMSSVQFGVMLIFNMCLGNITPPVGSVLFVGCGIGEVTIEEVTPKLIPYFVVLILALLAVTYIPALSLAIPNAMGLTVK
nr:TRAP transporter large permease [Shuttleworthia satelles]